jgi:hypothetical protein
MSEEKPKKKRKPKSAAEMMTTGSLGSPDLQRFSRVPRARPYGTREKVNHLSDPGDPDRKNLCNMIENVQRRSYGKSELAMLYFPDSNPHVALNRLNAWIRRCPPDHRISRRPVKVCGLSYRCVSMRTMRMIRLCDMSYFCTR